MFWVYWDTAWSIVCGGILFATIVSHPDAEFMEVRVAIARVSACSRSLSHDGASYPRTTTLPLATLAADVALD